MKLIHPVDQMRELMAGHIIAQCLYSLASLGIPDLITNGYVTIGDLAAKTGTDKPSLHRMLRTLASLGVLTEPVDGQFGLTPSARPCEATLPTLFVIKPSLRHPPVCGRHGGTL